MREGKKTKILYIANARFPTKKAHGIQIAKTCEAFIENGADLKLLLPRKKEEKEKPINFYGLREDILMEKIWTLNVAPATSFGWLLSSCVFGISTFFHIWKRVEKIFYSIDLDPVSFLGFIFFNKPCFFEMHGVKRGDFLNRVLFKRARGIIAINEAIKASLMKTFKMSADKIIVCPNGVDLKDSLGLTKEASCQKLELPLNKTIAVYTGSFLHWKGIETIIEAGKKLKDVEFYLVGGSKQELGNVHLVGHRDFKEMPLWRTAADVLIVTGTKKDKYSFYHTSPMKLFEYLAAGKPIVASETPAIKQVVTDKEVFFHEPDNPEDLKNVLEFILKNPAVVSDKIKQAYQKAEFYSWDNRAKKVLNFIKEKTCI